MHGAGKMVVLGVESSSSQLPSQTMDNLKFNISELFHEKSKRALRKYIFFLQRKFAYSIGEKSKAYRLYNFEPVCLLFFILIHPQVQRTVLYFVKIKMFHFLVWSNYVVYCFKKYESRESYTKKIYLYLFFLIFRITTYYFHNKNLINISDVPI